jgi:hypothetical protein
MKRGPAAALVLAAVLTGCSDKADPVGAPAPPPTSATATPSPTPTPTDAADPPASPEPATAPPPSTSGPLSARNLPTPAQLGKGWTVYDDPGGAEKGFRGNGTWTRKRDAHQAAYEALPVGCASSSTSHGLPIPHYALQGTYRNQAGGPAQLLVLRFADESKAAAYFAGYRARLRACAKPGGSLTVTPLWSSDGASAWVRHYTDASYTEVSVRSAASVALMASTASPGTQWTHAVAARLATTITR